MFENFKALSREAQTQILLMAAQFAVEEALTEAQSRIQLNKIPREEMVKQIMNSMFQAMPNREVSWLFEQPPLRETYAFLADMPNLNVATPESLMVDVLPEPLLPASADPMSIRQLGADDMLVFIIMCAITAISEIVELYCHKIDWAAEAPDIAERDRVSAESLFQLDYALTAFTGCGTALLDHVHSSGMEHALEGTPALLLMERYAAAYGSSDQGHHNTVH